MPSILPPTRELTASEPFTRVAAPPLAHPEILALYARDVDRTLLRETLRLTPDQRARKFMAFAECAGAMRGLAWPADQRAAIIAKLDARRDEG